MKIPIETKSTLHVADKKRLSFQKAVMGLRLDETTTPFLEYFNFIGRIFKCEEVDFLHVAPYFNPGMNPYLGNPITGYPLGKIYSENEWKRDKGQLTSIRQELVNEVKNIWQAPENTQVRYLIREGSPVEELVKQVQESKADLVVIGKNKDSNRHQINAKNIIRQTTANVLLVPEDATPKLERILVPFDFSEYAIRALRLAVAIKHWMPIAPIIQVIHVYEEPDYSLYNMESYRQRIPQNIGEGAREGFENFISEHLPEIRKDIHPITVKKDKKNIAYHLLEKGKEYGSDLIIMGAKGHSKLELFFLGSTTERVLGKNNSIPTLIVK